jgi:hypothetical protein
MVKGFRFIALFIICACAATIISAQEAEVKREFNTLYQPKEYILRASYDNFKKIKLLHAAILNFGGGEAEFNRLVDDYAEASALYFRQEYIASANLFTKNEKDILSVAMALAKKYKDDTDALHQLIIKLNVKNSIETGLKGKEVNPTADVLVRTASYGVNQANDYYARSRPFDAIYYFRRAKEACFQYYELMGEKVPDQYKKDVIDNKNKIYTAKEKDI